MHLSKRLPFAAWAFVIAGIASMGLPGFSGFVAEFQVIVGSWRANPWWTEQPAWASWWAWLTPGVPCRRRSSAIHMRAAHIHEHGHELAAITWPEVAGVSMLVGSVLPSGSIREILLDAIEPAVKTFLREARDELRGPSPRHIAGNCARNDWRCWC